MSKTRVEQFMENVSIIIEHENKKFLNEKIILNDVNSCLKVLHQLEAQDPSIKEAISTVKESVIKTYHEKLHKEYSERESCNIRTSFNITAYHENLNPERKKFRDMY